MAQMSSKHQGREQNFTFNNFRGGYTEEAEPLELAMSQLSDIMNMKYESATDKYGHPTVIAKVRQGTEILTTNALAADVEAAWIYYVSGTAHYIRATSSKIYDETGGTNTELGDLDGVPTFTEFNGNLIIMDGGITKYYDGTTFAKLVCLYEDEVLGTGNGIDDQFTGDITNTEIEAGSITITYISGGTNYTITDDGEGNLEGDVDAGGNNTIDYDDGSFDFTCAHVPTNATNITCTYNQVDGAPKSKAGFVRADRLYLYQDPDNPSRIWISGVNDETAWDTGDDCYYFDVQKDDGYELVGAVNFFTRVLLIKENSLHHIIAFPGDTDFAFEPLIPNLGASGYRTVVAAGGIVLFQGKEGLLYVAASDSFGDIKKNLVSKHFKRAAVEHANEYCQATYNAQDGQYWLQLYSEYDSDYLPYLYVFDVNLGLLSRYKFAFGHTCINFCHDATIIGGSDGHLYKLVDDESTYKDNTVSYASDTYIQGAFSDFGLPHNRKHNKKIYLHLSGRLGATATLKLFKDSNYEAFAEISAVVSMTDPDIAVEGKKIDIADMDIDIAYSAKYKFDFSFGYKFTCRELMWRLEDITTLLGCDVIGIEFKTAILGD